MKKKFTKSTEDTAVLEAALAPEAGTEAIPPLVDALERAERTDPEFAAQLRTEWAKTTAAQQVDHSGVVNQITGQVSGKVVQARDILGGISF